jgi:hypothetical protein
VVGADFEWGPVQGVIWTSSDGASWTQRNANATSRLWRITAGAGTFIAVGDNGTIRQSEAFPPSLNIRFGSHAELTLAGLPGRYRIEAADLLSETTDWTPLSTLTLSSGALTWVDISSSASCQRFYRAVLER